MQLIRFARARRLGSLLLSCTLCLCLCACSAPLPSGDVDADAVTFTDALGREVSVGRNPARVAALLGSFAEIWMLSGGQVCATADDAWEDFDLALDDDTVNLGATKSPSLEALLSSAPELVIASASTAANVEMKDVLRAAGINVVYFDVSCFDDYLHMLRICTEITGHPELYERNGVALKEQIDRTVSDFRENNHAPRVLYLRASAGYIRAKGSRGSVLGEMLLDLGCINIADNDRNLLEQLSIESILQQDPDHILVVRVGDEQAAIDANFDKMMEENPAWQALTAVQTGRVHYMERHLFHFKPNARWATAYETLTELLTPSTQQP